MALLCVGCGQIGVGAVAPRSSSHAADPLAWPGRALALLGEDAAASTTPLVPEAGRLLAAAGALLEAPALLVEGVATLDLDRLRQAGARAVRGAGRTVTAGWNLPWFWMPGRTLDLGRDAEAVAAALAHLERLPAEAWHTDRDDPRTWVFPPGTRVRADGPDLAYEFPDGTTLRQRARSQRVWQLAQWLVRTRFPAQERSWGFVVPTRAGWDARPRSWRAETILHELYHQKMQMEVGLAGWTLVYWPAYLATFPFTGWEGHWAEARGPRAAAVVDRGLRTWRSKGR